MDLTPDLIRSTYAAIQPATTRTPVVHAARLSLHLGIDLYLKLENLQHTNAFKARGALAKLLTLTEAERAAGVIACSAGNHAQGVAYHATRLGIPSTIVMPEGTPFNKIKRTEEFGAEVVLHGRGFDESVQFTLDMARDKGLTFIHPFDDPIVAAGQGSVALEMLEQQPDLDTFVVPIGGGGLIAGIALIAKSIKPEIQIIGVEAELYPSMSQQIAGQPIQCGGETIAEGIAVKSPGGITRPIVEELVDDIVIVSEIGKKKQKRF